MPSAIASSSRSSSSPAATAPSAFTTLKTPGSGVSISMPAARNRLPRAVSSRSSGRISAASPSPNVHERSAMDVCEARAQSRSPLVVDVHGGGRRLSADEERPLRLEVLLHRPVQIEVILAQVREHERVEAHPLETFQRSPVRGRLEGDASVAGIEHLAEEPLQVDRLGSRERRRTPLAADHPLDGTDEPGSAARLASSIERSKNAVVVLPFVPVTPATSSSFVGSPKNTSAAVAIALRTSVTMSCGTETSRSRSTTSAAAPRSIASQARSWPSTRWPGTQKKSAPSDIVRVSYARSPISTGRPPVTSLGASARIRASSSTAETGYRRPPLSQGRRAVCGESGGISRCWRLKRAISLNTGAATSPP